MIRKSGSRFSEKIMLKQVLNPLQIGVEILLPFLSVIVPLNLPDFTLQFLGYEVQHSIFEIT